MKETNTKSISPEFLSRHILCAGSVLVNVVLVSMIGWILLNGLRYTPHITTNHTGTNATLTTDVRSFIEGYFDSWSRQDMEAYSATFHPQAVIQFVGGGNTLQTSSLKPFIDSQRAAHARATVPMREVPLSIDIHSDGLLTRVLVRWELTKGEKLQTGTDYFLLLSTENDWQIAHLLFTND